MNPIKLILIGAAVLFAAAISSAGAATKVALVIGNSAYARVSPLKNPVNDAQAVAASFKRLNFKVITAIDAGKEAFLDAIDDFDQQSQGAKLAVVYYAGHAMQLGNTNYLVPVDAKLEIERHVRTRTVALPEVLNILQSNAKAGVLILDACRDNPFFETLKQKAGATRAARLTRGLARVKTSGTGTIIAFSAAAGQTADDGDRSHSPYTKELLKLIEKPGLELGLMFRQVAANVARQPGVTQRPEVLVNLEPGHYFVPPAKKLVKATPAPRPFQARQVDETTLDLTFWNSIKDSGDPALFKSYLDQHPNGRFAPIARARLKGQGGGRPVAASASEAIDLAFWEAIQGSKDPSLYESYLKQHPNGRFVAVARARIKAFAPKPERRITVKQAPGPGAKPDPGLPPKVKLKKGPLAPPQADVKQGPSPDLSPGPKPAPDSGPQQHASLPPADPLPTGRALVVAVQSELARLGCSPGNIDGRWGRMGRAALDKYMHFAGRQRFHPGPTAELLGTLRNHKNPVCPPGCGPGTIAKGKVCVALRQAPPPRAVRPSAVRRKTARKPVRRKGKTCIVSHTHPGLDQLDPSETPWKRVPC
jgi:hypothetical protein